VKSELAVVDLFSGAGGLSLGAARAGFSVRSSVEIDPHAIDTHTRNFTKTIHIPLSVSDLSGQKLRKLSHLMNGDLTGIIGGPPCQGFSNMGIQSKDDPRNKLFLDFFRIVSEAQPKFFLAENVPGIMLEDNTGIRDKAFSYVKEKYEILQPMKIKANEYGAPTTRTRYFFFGYLKGHMKPLTVDNFKPPSDVEKVFVKDALRGLPVEIDPNWQDEPQGWREVSYYEDNYFSSRVRNHIPNGIGNSKAVKRLDDENLISGFLGTRHSKDIITRYSRLSAGQREPIAKSIRLDPEGFCPTLRAGTGTDHGSYQAVRPIHPTEDRVITPREAARLQGFPDWFQFQPTKWHSFRQIGNSVSPIVAERLLKVVRKALAEG
jgi:DNA (cytosine-5)-methyltransferase 1